MKNLFIVLLGPLTSTGITAAAFLKNNIIDSKKDFPNYQLTFAESQTEYPVNVGLTRKVMCTSENLHFIPYCSYDKKSFKKI